MKLTEHFDLEEFELDGKAPEATIPMYTVLCHNLLEPLRIKFGIPIVVTSGYRSPTDNEHAHGVRNSQHVATADYCAADFKFKDDTANWCLMAFDWLREQTNLVWDQLILEHELSGGSILHLSVTKTVNRRAALEGDTANRSAYVTHPVAAFSSST